jgi:hypothetical protein
MWKKSPADASRDTKLVFGIFNTRYRQGSLFKQRVAIFVRKGWRQSLNYRHLDNKLNYMTKPNMVIM